MRVVMNILNNFYNQVGNLNWVQNLKQTYYSHGYKGMFYASLPSLIASTGSMVMNAIQSRQFPSYFQMLTTAVVGGVALYSHTNIKHEDTVLKNVQYQQSALSHLKWNNSRKETVLVLLTTNDPNGGLNLKYQRIHDLRQINREFSVEVRLVWDKRQIPEIRRELEESGKEVRHLIVTAHGEETMANIANTDSENGNLRARDFREFQCIADHGGSILFDACYTGAPNGLASQVAELLPGAMVSGPYRESRTHNTVLYLKEGRPFILQNGAHEGLTRIYEKGKPQRSNSIWEDCEHIENARKGLMETYSSLPRLIKLDNDHQ